MTSLDAVIGADVGTAKSSTPQTFRPRRVDRASSRQRNRLVAARKPYTVMLGRRSVELHVIDPAPGAVLWLCCRLGAGRAAIGLDERCLRAFGGGVEIDAAPRNLLAVYVEAILAPWFEAAEAKHRELDLRLDAGAGATGEEPCSWDNAIEVGVEVTDGARVHLVALRLDAVAADALAALLEAAAQRVRPNWLWLRGSIRLTEISVAACTLTRLNPGDAIVLGANANVAFPYLSLPGGLRAPLSQQQGKIKLIGELRLDTGEALFDQKIERERSILGKKSEPEVQAAAASPVDLNELEVRLCFDLGHVDVRLGDLDGLTIGHVFELRTDPLAPVRVLTAGRLIGHGELIDFGDAIGVRLVEISRTTPSHAAVSAARDAAVAAARSMPEPAASPNTDASASELGAAHTAPSVEHSTDMLNEND